GLCRVTRSRGNTDTVWRSRRVLLCGCDDSTAQPDHGTLRTRKTRYGGRECAPPGRRSHRPSDARRRAAQARQDRAEHRSLASGSADAQVAKEIPLMARALPDVPGREGLIERVELAPGEVSPAPRRNADVFAYVLEGSIITQVEGRGSQNVHAREVIYE